MKECHFSEFIKSFCSNGQMIFKHVYRTRYKIQHIVLMVRFPLTECLKTSSKSSLKPEMLLQNQHACEHENPLLVACATHAFDCCLLLIAVATCSDVNITNLTLVVFEFGGVGIERRAARFCNQNTMGGA